MRKRFYMTAMAAVVAVTGASVAVAGPGLKGGNLTPQAKVTLAAARHTALAARPGVITDQELEKEKGGSGLRYSFDIRSNGKTYEVGVDAKTGTVLENAAEGRNPD
ncbi:MAG: peptidase M4 [Sphingomonas sp. 66-10]|uniref:PepSY domain-containing protein n=1 Tax=Sphingomonas sp. 66-10 TaxID=1895848 RepID=UPI0009274BCC|nr:PepSY domain-containing protein [Sphingomonas sp. 66-10]OJU15108.1 MAG: peptidase M4 [Sphingomonas sp. 66-10]